MVSRCVKTSSGGQKFGAGRRSPGVECPIAMAVCQIKESLSPCKNTASRHWQSCASVSDSSSGGEGLFLSSLRES